MPNAVQLCRKILGGWLRVILLESFVFLVRNVRHYGERSSAFGARCAPRADDRAAFVARLRRSLSEAPLRARGRIERPLTVRVRQPVSLHDDVALLYLGQGFAANAVRHFQASAALKPESAPAHFNLGTALAQAGRFDDSIRAFRDALSRRPDYAVAHGNLGRVLLVKGDVGEALKHLQEGVRLEPNNPQNLLGLSEALAQRGAFELAIETIERAMKLPLSESLAKEILAKRAAYLQSRKAPP